jgi:hypothetical protein
MAIGARDLPGVGKLAEEAGEISQVVGKLIATDGQPEHWDGSDLHSRLVDEAGDMLAAIRYFGWANEVSADVERRAAIKFALFQQWHHAETAKDQPGALLA